MSDQYGLGIEDPDGYSPLSQLGRRFMADGPGVEAVEARGSQAARDAWAARLSNQARPLGGREEGWLTENPDFGMIVPRSPMDFALLATGGPFSRAVKTGALAIGGLLDSMSEAEAGKLPRFGGSRPPRLPMDAASRANRAREMGYADDVFYRGERSGTIPAEFPDGAHFSRSKDIADGFAAKGGATDSTKYRLKLDRVFADYEDLTAAQYSRLIKAAGSVNPKLARDLADSIAPGHSPGWVQRFAKLNPDFVVVKASHTARIRRAIENSGQSYAIFTRAGFDALDSGRDVQKLTGDGIRQASAAFDPAKARRRDTLASILALGGVPLAAASRPDPSSD